MPEVICSNITANDALDIIGFDRRSYPIVERLRFLENPQGTGLFSAEGAVGFSFAHNFRREYLDWLVGEEVEAQKVCSELDFLYIRREFRDHGFGSRLFYLAHQRMLGTDAQLFFTHITDRSGKMERLCERVGYTRVGRSRKYLDATEYSLSIQTAEERQAIQTHLKLVI